LRIDCRFARMTVAHAHAVLLDILPDPVLVADSAGVVTYCNPRAASMLGHPADQLLGLSTDVLGLPPDRIEAWSRQALIWYAAIVQRPDGQSRTVLVSSRPMPEAREQPEYLLTLRLSDAADSHTLDKEMERLAYLADVSAILASSLDFESTLARVAEAVVPVLADWCAVDILDDEGKPKTLATAHADPRKLAIAKTLTERYPPGPGSDDRIKAIISAGSAYLVPEVPDEILVAGAKNEEDLAMLRELRLDSGIVVPLLARDRGLGVISLVRSDPERRFTEADLPFAEELARRAATAIDNARLHRDARASEERFRNLFANAPEPMWVYDRETYRFLEVNDAAIEAYGYSRDEFRAMTITDVHATGEQERVLRQLTTDRAPYVHSLRWQHQLRDGAVIDVEVASHVLDFDGRPATMVVARDVTERKRMEEMEQTNRGLKEASRLKSEFLANMSHELRTPLNAIIGFSEILHDERFGALNDRQKRYASNVLGSGRHLLELVNDILDLSKIEAGRMDLHLEEVALGLLIEETLGTLAPLAQTKGIDLTGDTPDSALTVHADRSRLTQILFNLLSNAIKFTPDGGTVSVICRAEDNRACIAVRDTGIGIAPEDHERVFREFEQVDTSHGRQQQGTGLGLTLTKDLVELHGGSIALESAVGAGSTFTVSLPRLMPQVEGAVADDCVLIVEDDPASLELLQVYLGEAGFVARWTDRDDEVLPLARQLRPAAIILDIVLHGGEMWSLLADLKADPATRTIPVVIVSILDEQQRGLALGASEYLVKPVDQAELLEVLRRVATKRAPREGHMWQVLAVDDQMEALELIELALEGSQFQLIRATSGAQALSILEQRRPDIFLVDLIMAPLSGFDVIDAVLRDRSLHDIPIIVLTSRDLSAEERERLAERTIAVLPKSGFNKQRFLQELWRAAPKARKASSAIA
jgi:PAS domain S-box-containing protein